MSDTARWADGRPSFSTAELGQGRLIDEWLVVGCFTPNDAAKSFRNRAIGMLDSVDDDFLGGERDLHPREGQRHPNSGAPDGFSTWARLSAVEGYVLPPTITGDGVLYATTYIDVAGQSDIGVVVGDVPGTNPPVVQVILNGAEIGRRGAPGVIRLSPGRHCLKLKITGGASTRHLWREVVYAGVVQDLSEGVGIALIRPTGFWRGTGETPAVELDAVLINTSDSVVAVGELTAHLTDGNPGVGTSVGDLLPGEVRSVRLSAPLGDVGTECVAVVAVAAGATGATGSVSASVAIPRLPEYGTLHVMQGFHCDPVWVADQNRYNLQSLEIMRQLMDATIADPNYYSFIHEIDYVKPFIDEYPEYRTAVFELVKQGRVGVGSSYNEPNENNCSGEALIRNILYGQCFHRHFLGGDPRVYHSWDVFGHTPQLSQILAKSGHVGVLWCKYIHGFPPTFLHMSPDGTVLPTMRTSYGWGSRTIDDLRTSTASLLAEKHSFGIKRHFVCDAHDFSDPSGWMIGRAEEMAESYPKIVMEGPEKFVKALANDDAPLRVTSRNGTQYHIGTQHSRSEMKIANRMCENVLTTAERWATFASLMGANYPDQPLDMAWRQVLFGQHHDALTGTPCDMSYLDVMAGYREALEHGHTSLGEATQFIADGVKTPGDGDPVVVFNPMNWERGGVIRLENTTETGSVEVRTPEGQVLPSEVRDDGVEVLVDSVPSVGYTTLTMHASNAAQNSAEVTSGNTLQNEFWTITLDPERGGGISSLIDRNTGRELIDQNNGVGNDLVALREHNKRAEASWEFWTLGERVFASDSMAEVQIVTSPVKQVATITGSLGDLCTYTRTLILRPGQRHIEASVTLDGYAQEDNLFAVTTPLALAGSLPVVEDRFGTVVGRRGQTAFDYRTRGPGRPSHCAVYPVYNWAEAGWSARVDIGTESSLNLGLAGLIIPHDDEIEQQLGPLMRTLGKVGVSCTPYYDDDDEVRLSELQGKHGTFGQVAYDNTLMKRLDDIELSAEWVAVSVAGNNPYVNELLDRLPGAARDRIAADEARQGWSMIVAEDAEVPDGWPPMPVIVISAISHSALSDSFARIDADLTRDGRIVLSEGCDYRENPEIVDSYGFAYLTSGTGSATMEPDGTLTMFLTHTSNWSAVHLKPSTFVPEHRTMAFHYGMDGHEGSWRDGDVVRTGYDFLNPLTTAIPAGDGTELPPSRSFVSLDAADTVVTAIKPAGNPVAQFESGLSDARQGIIVRAYDSSGRGSSGRLSIGESVDSAFTATMMEEDIEGVDVVDGTVDWKLDPFAIETLRLMPGSSEWPSLGAGMLPSGNTELGTWVGAVQPVWCRYWKHNAGAHPIGYMPVGIYMDGKLEMENEGGGHPTVGRLRVWIVNNRTDESISGTAEIIAPERWTVLPTSIPYDIPPRGHMMTDITVAYSVNERTGLIKARMLHEEQVYQDVVEVGRDSRVDLGDADSSWRNDTSVIKEREPEWRARRDGDEVVVTVHNPWWEPLDAELVLTTPMETWGSLVGEHRLCDIGPAHAGMTIAPRGESTARFAVSNEGGATYWAWVKLMCNGKADYKRV
jgi:alpha-mannosidase